MHGVDGTFAATLRAMRWAECAGLKVEVNTLVCKHNAADLEAIVDLMQPFAVARWNTHFAVPVGNSREVGMLTADEVEALFARIDDIRASGKFPVRVVEAPQYRRFRLQRTLGTTLKAMEGWSDFTTYQADAPDTTRDLLDCALDGPRAFVYVSHAGDVAREFVPQSAIFAIATSLTSIAAAISSSPDQPTRREPRPPRLPASVEARASGHDRRSFRRNRCARMGPEV